MENETFNLTVENSETGETIKDEEVTAHESGFVDLWLPRDEKFVVTFEIDGMEATEIISTGQGDDTCITTSQLQ